jgi:hypothetical protein
VPSQTPDQGGDEQDGRDVRHVVHAREHPWLQFNQLSLMNAGGEQKHTETHGEAMRASRRQGEDKHDRR